MALSAWTATPGHPHGIPRELARGHEDCCIKVARNWFNSNIMPFIIIKTIGAKNVR